MVPRLERGTTDIPGGGTLRLIGRGDEFSIMLGGNELMNSRLSGSEEALAALACARVMGRARAAVLIGGLGMGFTLRAALAALAPDARVVVAEIGTLTTAIAIITDSRRGPSRAATPIARSRPGTASMMSTRRMMTLSTQPPKAPATSPSSSPTVAPSVSDTTPTSSE